jgi:hypothetical protein
MATAGTRKRIAEKEITHQDYINSLFGWSGKTITQRSIRSHNHRLYTVTEAKAALNSVDTKRYMLPDRIHTRALGHYRNNVQ